VMVSFTSCPSPYQVLRVAKSPAGMVKSGVMLVKATESVFNWRPFPRAVVREPEGINSGVMMAKVLAVYSMAWISQLEEVSPNDPTP